MNEPRRRVLKYTWAAAVSALTVASFAVDLCRPEHALGPVLHALIETLGGSTMTPRLQTAPPAGGQMQRDNGPD